MQTAALLHFWTNKFAQFSFVDGPINDIPAKSLLLVVRAPSGGPNMQLRSHICGSKYAFVIVFATIMAP